MSAARKLKTKTTITKEQREYCSRKYPVTQKPRSWHYIGPPRMANTMTARARPMPRQIGQAEAKQSQTCVKCQDRSIPITSISKTRSRTSMFPKKEAKTVTMCAWRALGLAVGAIASNAIKIAITEIKPSQTQIWL